MNLGKEIIPAPDIDILSACTLIIIIYDHRWRARLSRGLLTIVSILELIRKLPFFYLIAV